MKSISKFIAAGDQLSCRISQKIASIWECVLNTEVVIQPLHKSFGELVSYGSCCMVAGLKIRVS